MIAEKPKQYRSNKKGIPYFPTSLLPLFIVLRLTSTHGPLRTCVTVWNKMHLFALKCPGLSKDSTVIN